MPRLHCFLRKDKSYSEGCSIEKTSKQCLFFLQKLAHGVFWKEWRKLSITPILRPFWHFLLQARAVPAFSLHDEGNVRASPNTGIWTHFGKHLHSTEVGNFIPRWKFYISLQHIFTSSYITCLPHPLVAFWYRWMRNWHKLKIPWSWSSFSNSWGKKTTRRQIALHRGQTVNILMTCLMFSNQDLTWAAFPYQFPGQFLFVGFYSLDLLTKAFCHLVEVLVPWEWWKKQRLL